MPMPNRNLKGDYRYAYQGQEVDPETGKEAFQLRLWDGRIGRWLSPDPYGQYNSPYLGMGNNPITMVDPDGGFACDDCPTGTFADGAEHIGADGGTYIYDAQIGRWSDSSAVIFSIQPNQNKAYQAQFATSLMLSSARVSGSAAAFDGPLPIGDAAGGVVMGLATLTSGVMAINSALQDDYTITSDIELPYMVLYRGVHSTHPAYAAALNGTAIPWALGPVGHNDPAKHNSEDVDNYKSLFTSWTIIKQVANENATKHGNGGIILTKRFRINQVVPSPDIFNEGEWLAPGITTGAAVSFPGR